MNVMPNEYVYNALCPLSLPLLLPLLVTGVLVKQRLPHRVVHLLQHLWVWIHILPSASLS